MARNATICDVAREAGVSVCCVSWVLRNHPRSREVGERTRLRVLAAAEKIGYRRNSLASATRTGQVSTIAVILNFRMMQNLSSSGRFLIGIMMEASRRKLSVKIFSEEDLDNAFRTIVEDRIGKVISASVDFPVRERTAELAEKYALDLAFCYEHGHGKFPAVNTDNAEMTARAVHYLAEHGHTRIGLLCVPHRYIYVTDRHAGYLRGMAECGLKTDSAWVGCSDDIERTVDALLELPARRRPTAYVALTDSVAVRAQRQAWKRGLRIPEEFSVIGIGDTESSSAAVRITTFQEIFPETGKLLVQLICAEKPDFPPDEYNVYHTHAELVERDSVYVQDTSHKLQVTRYKTHGIGRKTKATSHKIQGKKQKGHAK